MKILVDTNVLVRSAQPGHPQHQLSVDSLIALERKAHTLCVVPQVFYEYWVVCTRPTSANGLGKTATETASSLGGLTMLVDLLDDQPGLFFVWQRLVTATQTIGKSAHDARLVAAMQVHGVTHLLTFNDQDFRRFDGITVLTPPAVLAAPDIP